MPNKRACTFIWHIRVPIMNRSNFCKSKNIKEQNSFTFHIILIDNDIFFCEKPYYVLKCLVGNETANQTTLKRQKVFSLSPWVSCHFSFSYFLLSFTFQWTRTSVFSSSLFFLQFLATCPFVEQSWQLPKQMEETSSIMILLYFAEE